MVLAQAPQRAGLGLVLGDGGVEDEALFHGFAEIGFHLLAQAPLVLPVAPGARGRPFEEHVPVVLLRKRIGRARNVLQHQVDALPAHQLAGGDIVFRRGMRATEKGDGGLGRGDGDPGGGDVLGLRPQLQHRARDDAQRAFGAEIEVAQVVAGIVLLEGAQPVPDLALGRYHFQAEHQLAGVAVVQDLHAAGVRREIAADRAASLGSQRKRKQPVVRGRRLLDGLQDDARLDRHRIADQVDVEDAGHAVERQHDLAALLLRDAAAHQAGIAPLRHHGDLLRRAEPHDIRDFLRVGRSHHGQRLAHEALAPVGDVGVLALFVGDQALVADDGAQFLDEVGLRHAAPYRGS